MTEAESPEVREEGSLARKRPVPTARILSSISLFLVLLLCFPAFSESAGTFTAFEKSYLRAEGDSVTVESEFTVSDPSASYFLKLFNNGLRDAPSERVNGSEIILNGVRVVRPADFNPKTAFYERPIALNEKNTLRVTLKGKQGGGITLRIVGTDAVPPQLAIIAPTADLLTNHSQPTFTLQYQDNNAVDRKSLRATLNGREIASRFDVGEHEATYTPDPLPDDSYTLVASIADLAENRTEAKVSFQIDATPPETHLVPSDSPGGSGWFPASGLETSDSGAGVAELHYQINSDPEVVIRPDPSDRRTLSLPLQKEGKLTLLYYAVDRAGNREAAQQRTVQIDRTPPQIKATLFPPPNEFGWHRTDVTVGFEGEDALSGLVSITPPVTLTGEGENQIVPGIAADRAGNEAKIETSVWIDKTPPTLSLDSIPEGAALATKAVPLTFSYSDSLSHVRPDRFTVVLNRVDLSPVFNPQPGEATKTFAMADRKYLLVASIEDRAGNKTELTRHFTVDTTPPDLTVTTPETGQRIKATAIRVAGKALDATTSVRSLRVNGIEIPLLPTGEFSAPLPLSNEGVNLLKIEAVDEAGNVAAKEIRLLRDALGPEFSEITPAPGSFVRGAAAKIAGKVRDLAGSVASLQINGSVIPLTHEKEGDLFSAEVPLPKEGENRIEMVAMDAVGNQTAFPLFSLIRDTAAPVIEIAQPPSGSSLSKTPIVVTGSLRDAGPIAAFSLNGAPVALQANRFSIEVPLKTGENVLSFSATDAAGNTAEVRRTILLDQTAPEWTITSPVPGRPVSSKMIDLTGRVVDAISSVASVAVNGIKIVPTASGDFTTTLPLNVEGENRFDFIATDAAGNQAVTSLTVIRDTRPPDLRILEPAAGGYTDEPALLLAGTVADRGSSVASLTVNGTAVPIQAGRFKTILALNEGENVVQVAATDAAGNIRTLSRKVILDTHPPKIVIESPPAGARVSSSAIILSGIVADPNPIVSLTLNGTPMPATRGAFKYPVVLSPGSNTFLFSATDAAGNVGTIRWEATFSRP